MTFNPCGSPLDDLRGLSAEESHSRVPSEGPLHHRDDGLHGVSQLHSAHGDMKRSPSYVQPSLSRPPPHGWHHSRTGRPAETVNAALFSAPRTTPRDSDAVMYSPVSLVFHMRRLLLSFAHSCCSLRTNGNAVPELQRPRGSSGLPRRVETTAFSITPTSSHHDAMIMSSRRRLR